MNENPSNYLGWLDESQDSRLHETLLVLSSEEPPRTGWSPKRNSSQGSQGICWYPKARSEVSKYPRKCLTLPVCWRQASLFAPQSSLPLSLEPLLSLTSIHLWLSDVSCCPFCSLSDIRPWRVHMCQPTPTPKLTNVFYWIPIMCCCEQGELAILLCFHLYFQLRAWEPCFPWVFPWVFPRVSALISPHSHALNPKTSSPINSP